MALFLISLTVLGCLSPLLTLAWFWQIKEWRIDRLLEELRREGWLTLWGKIRPAIALLYLVFMFLTLQDMFLPLFVWTGVLCVFAVLTAAQIGLGRQRRPVFTKKAITVTGTAGLLVLIATIAAERNELHVVLPLFVLLQPFFLCTAWLVWKPVDAFLKHRILAAAKAMRERHPHLTVIGVTGSVGKTTTKELLACVLKDLNPLVTPAHVNSEIGVAQWLLKTLQKTPSPPEGGGGKGEGVLIVEMGAYTKGEIALLCSFTQPTMGIVTHVGLQHVALFGSQETLIDAKAELIEALPPDGCAFLNGDNDAARGMNNRARCPVTIVGTGGHSDLEAFDITETQRGFRFRVGVTNIDVPFPGTHNVTNVLLALAVGETLGIGLPRMAELLRGFMLPSKTFHLRDEAGVRILDDTHNGSYASMKAAIAWARNQPEQRKVLLTAGLIEMGEHQAPAERELGAFADAVFERIVVINPLSARNFAQSSNKTEILSAQTQRVEPTTLLICSGRMPSQTINKLLPSQPYR